MSRLPAISLLAAAVTLLGCVSTPQPLEKLAARAFDFPIEGQLASVSVSDVVAIVRTMQPQKVYGLRVINHNRVEADTTDGWVTVGDWVYGRHVTRRFHSDESPAYTTVERVHGVWRTGAVTFITY